MKKIISIFALIILIACSEDYQVSSPTTSEKVDTLLVSTTDTLFMTEHDTILVSSTDTIRVSVLDSVVLNHTDTVSKIVKDTLVIKEIFNRVDTLRLSDTISSTDTVEVTIIDTIKTTDTVKVVMVDTISVTDTVKVSDTVFVSLSSSSEVLVSSSSVEESSSSEEVKGSVRDSITTFEVKGKLYTLFVTTIYFPEADPPVFHYNKYSHVCDSIGGKVVNNRSEVLDLKDTAFKLISDSSTTFIGIRKNHPTFFEYEMFCTQDSSYCYIKDRGNISTSKIDFSIRGAYSIGSVTVSPIKTYGLFFACKLE